MDAKKRRSILIEKGIKQVDLAKEAGVSEGMICQVINGQATSLRVQKIIAHRAKVAFNKYWSLDSNTK